MLAFMTSFGQTYSRDSKYGNDVQRSYFNYALGFPNDTFAIDPAYRNKPHMAVKGVETYLWSVAQQKWIIINVGAPGGGGISHNLYSSDDTLDATGSAIPGYRTITFNGRKLYYDMGSSVTSGFAGGGNTGPGGSIWSWFWYPFGFEHTATDFNTGIGSRVQYNNGWLRFGYGTNSNQSMFYSDATGIYMKGHPAFGDYLEISNAARAKITGTDSLILDFPKYNVKNIPEMWPYDSVKHKLLVYDYPTKRMYYLKHSPGLGGGGAGTPDTVVARSPLEFLYGAAGIPDTIRIHPDSLTLYRSGGTLQSVTDAGNTTTNAMVVTNSGGFALYDGATPVGQFSPVNFGSGTAAGAAHILKSTGTGSGSFLLLPVPNLPSGTRSMYYYGNNGDTLATLAAARAMGGGGGGGSAHGAANNIQISDGAGGFTSTNDFVFNPTTKAMSIAGAGATVTPLSIHKNTANVYPFISMNDGSGGGGYINIGGASGTGFIPDISMKPDGSTYNHSFIRAITQDAGSFPALMFDGAKSSGVLTTQPIAGWGSYGNVYMSILANKRLKLHDYGVGTHTGTTTTAPAFTSTGEMVEIPVDRMLLQNRTFSGNDTLKVELAAWYADFSRFEITFEELQGTTNTSILKMQVILNGSSTPLSSAGSYKTNLNLAAGATGTEVVVWASMENTTDDADAVANGTVTITKPNSAKKKQIFTTFGGTDDFGNSGHTITSSVVQSTTAIDQLYFFTNGTGFGGNLQGRIKIVGYKN